MGQRDTSTGHVFEQQVHASIQHTLARSGGTVERQVVIGERPAGGKHKVDLLLTDSAQRKVAVSVKVQNTPGTAEEKLAYEAMKLIKAMDDDSSIVHSYIVLGGTGFNQGMLDFARRDFDGYLNTKGRITVLTTDEAISKRDWFA